MLRRTLVSAVKLAASSRILGRGFAVRAYGGLKDSDRIFTNVYGDGSPFVDGAVKRVGIIHLRGRLA
jgi:hypothetical protein